MNLPYWTKPIYAGVVAFLGSLLAALQALEDGGIGDLSAAVWISIALTTLLAIGGVLGLQAAPASVATSVAKPD